MPNLDKDINSIHCPHCDGKFSIDAALAHLISKGKNINEVKIEKEIRSQLQKEYDQKIKDDLKVYKESLSNKKSLENKELTEENATMKQQLDEYSADRIEKNKLKAKLAKSEREKAELRSTIEAETEIDVDKKVKNQLQKAMSVKELEKEKALDEKDLQLKEKDLKIAQLKKKAQETEKIANQGSMQEQGEAMELQIEDWLKNNFPQDEIIEVKKGVSGADILMKVNHQGKEAGIICIESKRTKRFEKSWIEKLQQDMKNSSAFTGILVSSVLPKENISDLAKSNVWIYDYIQFKVAIKVLRKSLIEIKVTSDVMRNHNDKSSQIYKYLMGPKYRSEIESSILHLISMEQDVLKEKKVALTGFTKRETHIEQIINNHINVYGHIKAIAVETMPIEALEGLPSPEDKILNAESKLVQNKN